MLRGTFRDHGLASFVFGAAGIEHENASGHDYAGYVSTWSPRLGVVDEVHHEGVWANQPLAAVAIGDPGSRRGRARKATWSELFAVAFPIDSHPGKYAILVRAPTDRRRAPRSPSLSGAGCTLAEAVVVGDWVNDVPMFKVAGRSL